MIIPNNIIIAFCCRTNKALNHEAKTAISYSHRLYDAAHFVLVGSFVKTVPCVEHVIQIANLLSKE